MAFEKQNKMHYAWLVLLGCCALQGGSLGLINNCAGLYYAPVCNDLGFEMGAFTFYRMLYSISSALTLPLAAKLLQKFDVRVTISAAVTVFGLCNVMMGTFTELGQWYAIGILQGVASSFLCFLPAPVLLTNWFHKKSGTAIGISAAFSGLVGMMGSSGLGAAIPVFGWRVCYAATGLICIALILPFSIFVLRYRPEDKKMRAYGAEAEKIVPVLVSEKLAAGPEAESAGTVSAGTGLSGTASSGTVTAGNASSGTVSAGTASSGTVTAGNRDKRPSVVGDLFRQPIFYVTLIAYATSTASGNLNLFLTPYGLAAGLSMSMAAMLTTLSLFGNMTSKLVLGKASDVFGVTGTFLVSMAISCVGHLMIFTGMTGAVMAGALFYGITLPVTSVMLPLFCQLYWKGNTYGTAFSYISMAGTLLAAPCNTLFGRFYDMTGSYNLTIIVSFALMAGTIVMVWIAAQAGKKKTA